MNTDIIWFAVFVWMLILPMLGNHVFDEDYEVWCGGPLCAMPYRPSFGEKVFRCGIWWFFFGIVAAFYLMDRYLWT